MIYVCILHKGFCTFQIVNVENKFWDTMVLGIYQLFSSRCLYLLSMAYITAGTTLTVLPSSSVKVNQSVTLQCELDANSSSPPIVSFEIQSPFSSICTLDSSHGECRNTSDPFVNIFNTSCPSTTRFIIQVIVPSNWNNVSVLCQSLSKKSNNVVFIVKDIPEVESNTSSPYIVLEGQTATLVCSLTNANPTANITWRWIKTDIPNAVLHNGHSYIIPNITRERSGSYNCTVSNSLGISNAATIKVHVLYKPEVRSLTPSPYKIIEGETSTLECTVTDANPSTNITWKWIKIASPNMVLYNGPNYTIPNIQRGRSGSYSCTASNSVGTSEAVKVIIDVLYKPFIEEKMETVVNESNKVILTRVIDSNPLSNVSWYDGPNLLKSEITVNTTSFVIAKARCTDTKNFTLTASNVMQRNVSSLIELIVNCKPISDINNITLEVLDDTGFAFSTTIIAYPKPDYVLMTDDGTISNGIEHNMTVNAVNNYTIYITKTSVKPGEYGKFVIYVNNAFGETSISVNLVPQKKPTSPRLLTVACNVWTAKIQWMSFFNSGDHQTFTVHSLIAQQEASRSEAIQDLGENKLHYAHLLNLQPSTEYMFYVVAQNRHGNSSSEMKACRTLPEEYTNYNHIVGGSFAGTILLVVLVLVTVFLIRRRYACTCKIKVKPVQQMKTIHTTQQLQNKKVQKGTYMTN
uniref:Basement membrane-specific heparan sulfate proteoglycan core protein-like isoform X2 n=1 Tax=Crassostrea virginica TaxID=6565 RepID=A0A8B8AA18_CRAVI|nr:basement membrane-specific heparan sulfate proteoglycan core protein-like isoform X2 [Crassostrea virginica]